MTPRDTIAAVATPPGAGGVGVIRVSGAASRCASRARFSAAIRCRATRTTARSPMRPARRSIAACCSISRRRARTPAKTCSSCRRTAARSCCACCVARLVELGARHARPGEFSERAFLNGKLDLAQAEAVADLIASGSETAARAALRSLDGEFSRRVRALTAAVVRLRVWIEAAIDFPEEEIDFLSAPELRADLAAVRTDLAALLDGARAWRAARRRRARRHRRPPNAGKSSLLNALAASERAIVTEIPGTTRDLVRETVDIDGVALTLVDTAGLRESPDVVEREGIRRARAELERADVALLVTDADGDAEADVALARRRAAGRAPHRRAQQDRSRRSLAASRAPRRRHASMAVGEDRRWHRSAARGAAQPRRPAKAATAHGPRARVTSPRSNSARAHLDAAESALIERNAGELAAEELREVQHALGEITGEFSTDDLLGAIFSSFCIGK